MANQYLFLFPIKEYIEACLDACRTFELEGHHPGEIVKIIDARYRNNNFKINWLLFCQENNPSITDTSQVSPHIEIRENDGLLTAGVSFKRHTNEELYADADFVLNQLPKHQRLVLGGFHQWDCVDKIARRSYEGGIDTFVDEDTTDCFFGRQAFYGIPLVREKWSLDDLGMDKFFSEIKEHIIKEREKRPWFVQA